MEKKNILELHKMTLGELKELASKYQIKTDGMGKQKIIYAILDKQNVR